MAARQAREGHRPVGTAALAWLALLAAPLVLRGIALIDVEAEPGWGDLRGLAADVGVAGLCLGALWWPARRLRSVALLGVVLLTGVHYANYETVRALRAVVNFADAGFLGDATFFGGSVLAPMRPLLWVALTGAGGVAAWYGFSGLGPRAVAAIVGASLLFLGGASLPASDARIATWRQVNAISQNAVWLANRRTAPGAEDGGLAARHPALLGDLSGEPRFALGSEGRNVLLVVLEGVSGADLATAARAHGRRAAHPLPRLDAIFAENVGYATFLNHNRRTDRGLYALLCGEMPSLIQGLPKMTVASRGLGRRCLPERLRERGYRTLYLQAAPLSFMAKDQFLPRAGFQQVLGTDWFEHYTLRTLWGVDDRSFFAGATRLIEALRAEPDPWFLTLLSVGTHHPYVVPATAGGGGGAGAAFDSLDGAIGEFLVWLEGAGVRDDTLVLITSDEAAGLWPGTSDTVTAELTQNWGFLAALLPERERERIDVPHAQSDVALSVLDYLGLAAAADGLHGRSLFRRYAVGRHLFFGNVNLRTLSALAPDGYLLHCSEGGADCAGFDAFSGRMFAPTLRSLARRPELETLALDVAAASGPGTDEPELALALVGDARFVVDGRGWQLVHGTPVALAPGEWLEVELEVRAVGQGAVELEHLLRFPRRRVALRASWRLAAGQSVALRYTLASGEAIPRITCLSQARLVDGRQLVLELRSRRLVVHRGGTPPGAGLVVARTAGVPAGTALPQLEVMAPAEIDGVARSMLGGATPLR
ncbi:MAG: sulfatase-like hydrolase/transferase [Deltaproteobacteria bacterium]|nr:sulfatase-like hydrolase/transferase [Deltaproteobacteria bacterium]